MVGENGTPETPEWELPKRCRRTTEATDEQWQAYAEAAESHIIRGEN